MDLSVSDIQLLKGLLLAQLQMVNSLKSATPFPTLTALFGPGRVVGQGVDAPDKPDFLVWKSGTVIVGLVGGIRNFGMGLDVAGGWTDANDVESTHGFNSYAFRKAGETLVPAIQSTLNAGDRVYLVGQSLGGMVVHATNWRLFGHRDHAAEWVVTTAAPRALASGFDGFYPASNYAGFTVGSDIFPSLPPRLNEAPVTVLSAAGLSGPMQAFGTFIGQVEAQPPTPIGLWPRFHHAPGLIALSESGFQLSDGHPAFSAELLRGGMPWPAMVNTARLESSHDIAVNVLAAVRWMNNPQLKAITLPPVQEKTNPAPVVDQVLDALQPVNDGFFILPISGVPTTMAQKPIATASIPGPDGTMIGILILRGEQIATFPTRGKASTAARALNRFLARLPVAGEVSLDALQSGIAAYLADAAFGRGVDRRPVRVVS